MKRWGTTRGGRLSAPAALILTLCLALPLAAWGASGPQGRKGVKVDLDLTGFNGLMAYSGLFNIFSDPDPWVGKVIKIKGRFETDQDPETGVRYFGVSIVDDSACCALGLDFVLRERYRYPEDYPAEGADVTVAGKFDIYQEGGDMFCRLVDADLL